MTLFVPGLVSISFRKLTPHEIVELARRAGLAAIEWGGDVHAPHGDAAVAKEVGRMTRDEGLRTLAYGSYYRLGESEEAGLPFEAVVESAAALGALGIRVWAGQRASADADESYRARVAGDARRVVEIAGKAKLWVATEYHANTLTDTNESAAAFFQEVDDPALQTYWQPPNGMDPAYCLDGLRQVMPRLTHLHVFHWVGRPPDRRALAEGADLWRDRFEALLPLGGEHGALLEFVRGDDPEALLADAATLLALLEEMQG